MPAVRLVAAAALLAAAFAVLWPSDSLALSSNETVALAGEGRYEALRVGLEAMAAKGPLRTRDLHALCFAYSRTKRYSQLFSCLDQLEKNVANGDRRTRLFGLDDATPALHLMRAEAHLDLAAYALASKEADKARQWLEDEYSDDTDLLVEAHALLSMAAAMAGERARAEQHIQQLENISTFTLRGNGYVSAKAMALARAHMALGNYQQVLASIERDKLYTFHSFLHRLASGALLTGKNNWAWQELPRAFMINRALEGIGKTSQARDGYDQLLAYPQIKDNGEIYWQLLFARGQIAEQERQFDMAIDLYQRAIDVIELHRASINTESSKIGFISDKQRVYQRLIDLLYARGAQTEAFDYIERSKSRALVDMLAARSLAELGMTRSAKSQQLAQELEQVQQELRAQTPVDAATGKSGQRNLAAGVVARLRQADPELSSLVAVSSVPAERLQALLPADEAMIQYYYHGTLLYASVYAGGKLEMVRLDASGLDAEIEQFRAAIDQEAPTALEAARRLYDRLLRPLESAVRGYNRLLIVPHGALHYLPFSALHNGRQYVLDTHVMRLLPSASILPYLRTAQQGSRAGMLVLGNPDLGDPRNDLPSAQIEAERIASMGQHARLMLRLDASETAIKSMAEQYPVVHIASHGIFDNSRPLDSALMLAKDAKNDGRLTLAELYALRLDADLVTLSACETGLGRINNGDDIVGLTRGFLYAGTRGVVASLWQVDDEATANLMVRFYEGMKTRPRDEALREAQLAVRSQHPHPYYWSAFYLTGSAR